MKLALLAMEHCWWGKMHVFWYHISQHCRLHRNNACIQPEQKLDKDNTMLWCSCCHYVGGSSRVFSLSVKRSWHNDLQKATVPMGSHRSINLRHSYISYIIVLYSAVFCVASQIIDSETTWTPVARWRIPETVGADHHILEWSAFRWYIISEPRLDCTGQDGWQRVYIASRF